MQLASLPAVDALLRHRDSASLIEAHGRAAVTQAIRDVLQQLRNEKNTGLSAEEILARVTDRLHERARPTLRRA